ncbi:SixA phosphatase family protein [Varibaculum cambriense]|uniref:SixA phosphatase family protein n=1 Tax=Varibaculum cambriense TaxID=184870 RepID=UPI0028FFADB5|nr:histidine phosphatase family protein [Varibaculum cambriense]MDU1224469.1 histidine phosphatase family protein [Varibaculum cambriense]
MSYELTLVRHAQAGYGRGDHSRPLTPAGIRQARELGAILVKEGVEVELILHSTAARATQTAQQLGRAYPGARLLAEDELYHCSPERLQRLVSEYAPAGGKAILVVGHEPIISMTAQLLAPENAGVPYGVSTATAITFKVPGFSTLTCGSGELTGVFHAPLRG